MGMLDKYIEKENEKQLPWYNVMMMSAMLLPLVVGIIGASADKDNWYDPGWKKTHLVVQESEGQSIKEALENMNGQVVEALKQIKAGHEYDGDTKKVIKWAEEFNKSGSLEDGFEKYSDNIKIDTPETTSKANL